MFSGKTEELIRRLRRARLADQVVEIFKPVHDTRYDDLAVVSHDDNRIMSTVISRSKELLEAADQVEVVGIDEAQFLDHDLPAVCGALALKGIRVIVSGLDMDYRGQPFGPMPALLAMAEYITKLHAICPHCGNLATHTYRITAEDETIVLGQKDKYEPRCRRCYDMGNILDLKIRR